MNNKIKQTKYEEDDVGEYFTKQLKEKEKKINNLIRSRAPKSELQKALNEIKEIEINAEYIPDAYSGFFGDYDNGMYKKYLRRIKYIKNKLKYYLI